MLPPHKRIPSSKFGPPQVQYGAGDMRLPEGAPGGKVWERGEEGEMRLVEDPECLEVADCVSAGEALASAFAVPPSPSGASSSPPPLPSLPAARVLHKLDRTADTLQGLSIKYRTTVGALSRLNSFDSSAGLLLAPDVLLIPETAKKLRPSKTRTASQTAAEQSLTLHSKLRHLTSTFPSLTPQEALVYLKTNGGSVERARVEAEGDLEWERGEGGREGRVRLERMVRGREGVVGFDSFCVLCFVFGVW